LEIPGEKKFGARTRDVEKKKDDDGKGGGGVRGGGGQFRFRTIMISVHTVSIAHSAA